MTNNLAKWTPEEDQLLREGVNKHGIKWQLVKSYMRDVRSINSIIKRWHGKIKYEKQMAVIRESTGRFPKILPESPTGLNLRFRKIVEEQPQCNVEEKPFTWKKNWVDRQDKKLRLLVVQSGIMNWEGLAAALETSPEEVAMRWKKVVYPKMIRQSSKVGGSLKWSAEEDRILSIGYKQDIDWEEIGRHFLPQRSMGSFEARWRRIAKCFEVKEATQDKYQARKDCLKRIARNRRLALQKQNAETEGKVERRNSEGFKGDDNLMQSE